MPSAVVDTPRYYKRAIDSSTGRYVYWFTGDPNDQTPAATQPAQVGTLSSFQIVYDFTNSVPAPSFGAIVVQGVTFLGTWGFPVEGRVAPTFAGVNLLFSIPDQLTRYPTVSGSYNLQTLGFGGDVPLFSGTLFRLGSN